MGACQSSTTDETTRQIDKMQKEALALDHQTIKMLLLGAGESGKSTIFKQLKILHEKGFTEEDRANFQATIHTNVVENARDLLSGALATNNYTAGSDETVDAAIKTLEIADKSTITPELVEAIKTMWAHSGFKKAWEVRSLFQIADSAHLFFDEIDRISAADYEATDEDILRCRVRTTGVTEMPFKMNDVPFRIFDVGGQRTERRKWIHCFQDTSAMIYVAALSEYDQTLFEDTSTNRMHEALKLFGETCNLHYFKDTAMLLFLNKKDLFEEKVTSVPLTTCFHDYMGSCEYNEALQFITDKFLEKNKNVDRSIYVHVTCATDTGNIKFVFEAVKDVILSANLQSIAF